jgi:hypothetical protein
MLTVTHGSVAWPAGRTDAAQWTREARTAHRERSVARESDIGAFLGLAELMFGEIELRPLDVLEDACWGQATTIAHTHETQVELAGRAWAALAADLGQAMLGQCRAILYLTSSVDRAFFQSSVVRLAARHGMHRVPHWGLGQLQGTSLAVALDVAHSLLANAGGGVLLIAAETWPMPLPRAIGATTVLCDGAVALWVSGDAHARGLRVCASDSLACDPFVSIAAHRIKVDEATMLDAAEAAILRTLNDAGLAPADVAVRHSELRPELDAALCCRLGIALADAGSDWAGWACAAAAPRQVAEMLASAEVRPMLLWNLSLAGGASAVLLRHTGAEGHDA